MPALLAKLTSLSSRSGGFLDGSGTQIGDLLVDGVTFESITRSNRPTEHPIAQAIGSSNQQIITDHVINNPLVYRMEGFMVDTPQNLIGSIKSVIDLGRGNILQNIRDRFRGKGQKQNLAVEILAGIADNNVLVDVVAYRESFTNMLITSLEFLDEADSLERFFFKATLQQMLIVEPGNINDLNPASAVSNLLTNRSNLGNQIARMANSSESTKASAAINFYKTVTGG